MAFVDELLNKAKAANKTIVLCEGEDKRVVEAASKIVKDGIAKIILIGSDDDIKASGSNADLSGVTIIDPAKDANADKYAELLYKAREGKINKKTGAPEYADVAAAKAAILKDHTMYGALILKAGDADGFVSGACHSTANTLRPGLQVIKTAPGFKTVSSCFIMVAPECGNPYIKEGVSVFGDCAINIEPTAEELSDIAIASADTAKKIAGIEPRVAMLEEYEHAKKRGAKIYAELAGYGCSSDAYHITAPSPDGAGGVLAMQKAFEDAGMKPEDVQYYNAHGTSTTANDNAESAMVKAVFGDYAKKLHISSTKSETGHMVGAAGAVEAIICVKAMEDNFVPPTINLDNPDVENGCDLDYTPNVGIPCEIKAAASCSLGFGGHNGCVILKKL